MEKKVKEFAAFLDKRIAERKSRLAELLLVDVDVASADNIRALKLRLNEDEVIRFQLKTTVGV